jgi:hypothetical protein
MTYDNEGPTRLDYLQQYETRNTLPLGYEMCHVGLELLLTEIFLGCKFHSQLPLTKICVRAIIKFGYVIIENFRAQYGPIKNKIVD